MVANAVYNENYETLAMRHDWLENKENRTVAYKWKKGDRWNLLKILAEFKLSAIARGGETEFITEHYWGYAKVNEQSSNEYEVTHPRWKKYNVIDFKIDVDYGVTYGSEFEMLNQKEPSSVMLAEGSKITVESKRKIQ